MTATARAAPPITAVVLAAGSSQRFGAKNKLLMPWGRGEAESPVLRHVVEMLRAVPVSEIVVVTGNESGACRAALQGLDLRFAHNQEWASGMGPSIAVGIEAVSEGEAGALIVPGDMPGLTCDVISRLVAAFDGQSVVVPVTDAGEQRNPVLWPRSEFHALRGLQGDKGAKMLLSTPGLLRKDVVVEDARVFADIDCEEEYLALREALQS